jgi:hypothetical protein
MKTMTSDEARAAILAETAPKGLIVTGSLYLSGCTGLKKLPEGLRVKGWMALKGCNGLAALSKGLSVCRSLFLDGCEWAPVIYDDKKRCYDLRAAPVADGSTLYLAGCRKFTAAEAIAHWSNPSHDAPEIAAEYVKAIKKHEAEK